MKFRGQEVIRSKVYVVANRWWRWEIKTKDYHIDDGNFASKEEAETRLAKVFEEVER